MRRHLVLTLSVGLNVVLLAAWLVSRQHAYSSQAQTTAPAPAVSNVVRTHVVVRKQFFSWQELESSDYRAYIANLRDIGCPEQTIRDIIIADVNQLYAKRRDTEIVTPEQQWWRYDPDPAVVEAANAKLAALDQERQSLLTTLLGPNWAVAEPANTGIALNGPVLGELSPETKHAVQDAVTRSQQRTQAYLDAQKAAGKPVDPAELARLGQQLRTELAQLLSPAQLEEFLLRYSQTAASLRQRLRGVEVTADEFRTLWHAADPLEQKVDLADGSTKANLQLDASKQLDDALRNVLGTDRYQAYQVTQEQAYQEAMATADDNGGATSKEIRALYEVNKLAQQEQQRINNDDTLAPEQKAAQLAMVQQQQQAASDRILGNEPDTPPTPPLPPSGQIHPYSPGESLDMIAAKYGVSRSAILGANATLNFNALTPGTPIIIPPPPSQQ